MTQVLPDLLVQRVPPDLRDRLVMQGLPVGKCLDPIQELNADQKAKLRKVLEDMDLL